MRNKPDINSAHTPIGIVVPRTSGTWYAFQNAFSLVARSHENTSLKMRRSCGMLKASRESSMENKKWISYFMGRGHKGGGGDSSRGGGGKVSSTVN